MVNSNETIFEAKILTGKKKFGLHFDNGKELLIIQATRKPEEGKANKEIAFELKRIFRAEAEIVSGQKSRKKKIKVFLPREKALEMIALFD